MTADVDIPYADTKTVHNAVSVPASGENTSDPVDLRRLKEAAWSVSNGLGTNVTFEVLTSVDGVAFDTIPYDSMTNLAAGAKKTKKLDAPIRFAKIKITNLDASNASVVTTKIFGKL